jgi:glycosyltransferase involved in cell wall biosynthesis
MGMSHKIVVFIPMYNCEKQIPRVLSQFTDDICEFVDTVLVVDNGSTDNSVEAAKDALEGLTSVNVELIQNQENVSLGGSHKVAFNYMLDNQFDYLVVLHGDDQGSIQDLLPHLKSKEYERYDTFLGARFLKGSSLVGYSSLRIFLNHCCNLACSLVSFKRVHDIGSGLNMYSRDFLSKRFYMDFPNNLNFNVYMMFYGFWVNAPYKYFNIVWREDDQVSNARLVKQGIEILKVLFRYLLVPKSLFVSKTKTWALKSYSYNVLYSHDRSSSD